MSLYREILRERHHLSFPYGKASLGADYICFPGNFKVRALAIIGSSLLGWRVFSAPRMDRRFTQEYWI